MRVWPIRHIAHNVRVQYQEFGHIDPVPTALNYVIGSRRAAEVDEQPVIAVPSGNGSRHKLVGSGRVNIGAANRYSFKTTSPATAAASERPILSPCPARLAVTRQFRSRQAHNRNVAIGPVRSIGRRGWDMGSVARRAEVG